MIININLKLYLFSLFYTYQLAALRWNYQLRVATHPQGHWSVYEGLLKQRASAAHGQLLIRCGHSNLNLWCCQLENKIFSKVLLNKKCTLSLRQEYKSRNKKQTLSSSKYLSGISQIQNTNMFIEITIWQTRSRNPEDPVQIPQIQRVYNLLQMPSILYLYVQIIIIYGHFMITMEL